MTHVETNDPVKLGGRSVATKLLTRHFITWVCGSNSHVPPPAPPSAPSSFLPTPIPPAVWLGNRLSPVAVALTDAAPVPRYMEMMMSSIGRWFIRERRVRENLPVDRQYSSKLRMGELRGTTRRDVISLIGSGGDVPPYSSTDMAAFTCKGGFKAPCIGV